MEKLKQLGPSAIDAELRQLGPDAGGSVELLVDFLHMLSHQLQTNRDFELTQAYLGLFLKVGVTWTLESDHIFSGGQLEELWMDSVFRTQDFGVGLISMLWIVSG